MWLKRIAVVGFLVVATAGTACAQTEAKDLDGKIGLDFTKILDATPEVEVFLEKALLTMMSSAMASVEPEVADILPTLSLVQVQLFEDLFESNDEARKEAESAKLLKTIEGVLKDLEGKGWSRIVRIPEDNINILGKMDDQTITGLAVFVLDDDELVFVNIAGSIDAASIGKTLGTLPLKYMAGDLDLGALGAVLNLPGMAPPSSQPAPVEDAEEKGEDDGGQEEETKTENE
jgi:uncharacterized protein DUF4252